MRKADRPPHEARHASAENVDRASRTCRSGAEWYTPAASDKPLTGPATTYASVGWRLPLEGFTRSAQRDSRYCFHAERPSAWRSKPPIDAAESSRGVIKPGSKS